MKAASTAAARRYARALLQVARETAEPEALREELRSCLEVLATHEDLYEVLTHPAVAADKKRAIVAAVWSDGRASGLLMRLLQMLASRNRLELLGGIVEAFGREWNAERGVLSADAESAVPLDPGQQAALSEALARSTGKQVELRTRVEPTLLGGVRLSLEGRVYDGSVRAQLAALRKVLVGDKVRV